MPGQVISSGGPDLVHLELARSINSPICRNGTISGPHLHIFTLLCRFRLITPNLSNIATPYVVLCPNPQRPVPSPVLFRYDVVIVQFELIRGVAIARDIIEVGGGRRDSYFQMGDGGGASGDERDV